MSTQSTFTEQGLDSSLFSDKSENSSDENVTNLLKSGVSERHFLNGDHVKNQTKEIGTNFLPIFLWSVNSP